MEPPNTAASTPNSVALLGPVAIALAMIEFLDVTVPFLVTRGVLQVIVGLARFITTLKWIGSNQAAPTDMRGDLADRRGDHRWLAA